ncbi:SH3 domain-containing protein [Helicobacter sp. T3_23-1056]
MTKQKNFSHKSHKAICKIAFLIFANIASVPHIAIAQNESNSPNTQNPIPPQNPQNQNELTLEQILEQDMPNQPNQNQLNLDESQMPQDSYDDEGVGGFGSEGENINAPQNPLNSSAIYANPDEKLLFVKNATNEAFLGKTIYVGQKIPITYNALFFNGATLSQSAFQDKTSTDKITLQNPLEVWQKSLESAQKGDDMYSITYVFKIKSSNAVIPAFEVNAISQDGGVIDSFLVESIAINALDLHQNKRYVGVVADRLELGAYKARSYDEEHNLVAFEINARNANLEDFKLPSVEKQGIERSNFTNAESSAIFYALIPKNIQSVSFEYFSLSSNRFEEIRFPAIPNAQNAEFQEDLKPKNTYLLYTALGIAVLGIICVGIGFICKPPLRYVFWVLAVGIFAYLLHYMLYSKSGVVSPNKHIWILPTHNSTLLETTTKPIEVKIIGEYSGYYKIITPEEKVGWVKQDDVE